MSSFPSPDPEKLLCLARAGNGPALGQLLLLHDSYLALLARLQIGRRLQGKVDAADLVQDTFLAAHRHFAQFRGTTEAEFAAWLRQILATTVAKLVRHYCGTRRRDVRLERDLAIELDQSSRVLDQGLVAALSSPSQRAARREQAVLLADALVRLPQTYREVLVLHHLEGLALPAVAHRLGRTLDSVKNVWIRALARLRHCVGNGS
ncbi:MAG TPA: sigma-70 family RNA polymerase sigma factor [Gemmataceae bacterium]|nr:sigma-70 family RNA polymerase sigma factor [Gemmataceae bacterium]